MIDQDELLKILEQRYSTDNKGDYMHVGTAMTVGVVVDTDDPLQQGRLRVFCPSWGHDPAKIFQLPWCVYVSPFGGTINNANFERNGQGTTGAVTYGMWAVPTLGANVLVGCIDGDQRRPYWIGCIYDQQDTHTIMNGRWEWGSGGSVNGPLSSDGNPIQPNYENAQTAFGGNSAPEFQTRVAEYTTTAVTNAVSQQPNPSGDIDLDQQQSDIAAAQQFGFNQQYVGGQGYDFCGFQTIPMQASRVMGWTSPGFHSFSMDDRPFNMRSKWRSSSGHMVILDDTNDRIYIATNKGMNYIEMDAGSGNVDVYAKGRISLHSDSDINLDAVGSIRMTAGQGIYGYAGGPSGLPLLSANPTAGEIRLQAQADMSVISNNYRQLSFADTIFEIGGNQCMTVGGDYFLQVQYGINILTNDGDYDISISGSYNLNVLNQIQQFAINGSSLTSRGDVSMYSYYGNMNLAAQQNIVQKSVSGNVTIQAVGANSAGTGAVNMKAPNSQVGVSETGSTISTTGSMNMQSGGNMNVQSNSPSQQAQPIPSSSVPNPNCPLTPPLPIAGYTGVDLCARVAFNAGFRGQALVTAVAIAGAESSWNPNATGDVNLETSKWGPSLGFWQVRTLVNPSAYSYPDTLRVNPGLYDPQLNANAAYAFSNSGQNFGPWSTYMSGAYLGATIMNTAINAINSMCGTVTPTPSPAQGELFNGELSFDQLQFLPEREPPIYKANPTKPSIYFTDTGIILQSLDDISFVSVNTGESINAYSSIKVTSDASVAAINEIISIIDGCCHSTMGPITPMIDTGESVPVLQIPSNYFPYVDPDDEVLLNLENFNLNGGTILTV